jgi:2-polyprenyl-3-methyl-5-hydroxy-6-metoxy-1,4-benzoquinol methylase
MDKAAFSAYRHTFDEAARRCLRETNETAALYEAAFPAYTDPNPLIRFLMWRRVVLALREFDRLGPCDQVLDFGCGSGILLHLLAPLAKRVVGADVDLRPLRGMEKTMPLPSNVTLIDTGREPLASQPDNRFDCVFAMEVLEHIDDLKETLQTLRRITRPGGTVIFSGPTENVAYRIGRWIAGSKYTGDYHVSDIDRIYEESTNYFQVSKFATLYPPMPLVKMFIGTVGE